MAIFQSSIGGVAWAKAAPMMSGSSTFIRTGVVNSSNLNFQPKKGSELYKGHRFGTFSYNIADSSPADFTVAGFVNPVTVTVGNRYQTIKSAPTLNATTGITIPAWKLHGVTGSSTEDSESMEMQRYFVGLMTEMAAGIMQGFDQSIVTGLFSDQLYKADGDGLGSDGAIRTYANDMGAAYTQATDLSATNAAPDAEKGRALEAELQAAYGLKIKTASRGRALSIVFLCPTAVFYTYRRVLNAANPNARFINDSNTDRSHGYIQSNAFTSNGMLFIEVPNMPRNAADDGDRCMMLDPKAIAIALFTPLIQDSFSQGAGGIPSPSYSDILVGIQDSNGMVNTNPIQIQGYMNKRFSDPLWEQIIAQEGMVNELGVLPVNMFSMYSELRQSSATVAESRGLFVSLNVRSSVVRLKPEWMQEFVVPDTLRVFMASSSAEPRANKDISTSNTQLKEHVARTR